MSFRFGVMIHFDVVNTPELRDHVVEQKVLVNVVIDVRDGNFEWRRAAHEIRVDLNSQIRFKLRTNVSTFEEVFTFMFGTGNEMFPSSTIRL